MRKPISKHGLRRALEQAQAEGMISWDEPTGAVVDRIWHDIGKEAYNAGRKKDVSRSEPLEADLIGEERLAEA